MLSDRASPSSDSLIMDMDKFSVFSAHQNSRVTILARKVPSNPVRRDRMTLQQLYADSLPDTQTV